MKGKAIYFPGLNGIRSIAAIGVMISHITFALDKFGLDAGLLGRLKDGKPMGLELAGYGVTIFFVLSGFLITYLLQAERSDSGDIDIKKFYVRRILRIWPLYYLYMALCMVAMLVFGLGIDIRILPCYIFYAANVPLIINEVIPLMAHYWSLGVEEQFYLFWPWANKKLQRYLLPFIIAFIALQFGAILFLHFFHPGSVTETALRVTRFHCMMVGALGAIFYRRNNALFLKLADHKIMQLLSWSVIVLLMTNRFHVASVIDTEIVSIVSLALIIGQIRVQNRLINLDRPVFNFLGRISYGLYVIHPLLIMLLYRSIPLRQWDIPLPIKYVLVYGTVSGVTILMAYLSYRYFEEPFLRLKKKFVVVDSSPVGPDAAS